MPNIYELTGLFPGPSGVGDTTADHHPGLFIEAGQSITLGPSESGIYIPVNDFKYGQEFLNDDADQDARFLVWNILEKLSYYISFEHPEFKSISISESNISFVNTAAGALRKKDYNISLWFKPLTQQELEQDLEFDIDKNTANQPY